MTTETEKHMSEENKHASAEQKGVADENKQKPEELSAQDLEKVAGGGRVTDAGGSKGPIR
jgi:hypothetical protein